MDVAAPSRVDLAQAYAACRSVAKAQAKNFYYAFVALPPERCNAICAIYAFMRQADDLADDESVPPGERRRRLGQWRSAWRRATEGEDCADPVFLAVLDATRRFSIPFELLEKLIDGVETDLDRTDASEPATYPTFRDLYGYCYLVASVVGLICIRIFGYRDPAAEKLAEETGIAFQLTNILRDVVEDAERGRIYLPLEDLRAHGVTVEAIRSRRFGAPPTTNERSLLAAIAARAEGYYASARRLLPLIAPESRPALWVLVTIYHRLLQRICRSNYDVFSRRASVPRTQKLAILAAGQIRMAFARPSK
jgi:phytoene synthase